MLRTYLWGTKGHPGDSLYVTHTVNYNLHWQSHKERGHFYWVIKNGFLEERNYLKYIFQGMDGFLSTEKEINMARCSMAGHELQSILGTEVCLGPH